MGVSDRVWARVCPWAGLWKCMDNAEAWRRHGMGGLGGSLGFAGFAWGGGTAPSLY